MTLYLSKFNIDAPEETAEKIAELNFAFDEATRCYVAGFDGIKIPGESSVAVHVSCTDPHSYLSVVVSKEGGDVVTLVAALKNYAHATIQFQAGCCLDVHVERSRHVTE